MRILLRDFKENSKKLIDFLVKNIKTYLFLWLTLISLLVYYLSESYKLVIVGFVLVFLGLHFFKTLDKPINVYGLFVIFFGIILAIINFDFILGFAGMVLLLWSILFLNYHLMRSKNTIMGIVGFLVVVFIFFISIKMAFPTITALLDVVFRKGSIQISYAFFLSVVTLLIISAIFSITRYLLFLFSKIRGLKKINNIYLTISLTIILLVFLIGLWTVRTFYINDYPSEISFSDNVVVEKQFVCNSKKGALYFLHGDTMICNGIFKPPENRSIAETKVEIKKADKWEEDYEGAFFDIKNDSLTSINLLLNSNIEMYIISISFRDLEGKIMHNEHETLEIQVLTQDDYNRKIRERVSFVAGILLIALFSVFSAIANLKKILEERNN